MYDKEYFYGKNSNYIFGYNNIHFYIFWRRRLKNIYNFSKSGILLDIGCAFGYFLKLLNNKYQSYGLDISDYAVKKAKNNLFFPENIKLANIENKMPFSFKFDIITVFDVIEYLSSPETVLQRFYNSLNKKGKIYLEFPFAKTIIDRDKNHFYRPFQEWFNIVKKAGFKINFYRLYYTFGFRIPLFPVKNKGNYCVLVAEK